MMQYLTEDGDSGFFNCDERVIQSRAHAIASDYFGVERDANTYSIAIIDFEKRTAYILEFQMERNITVNRY